jgi:hypothetical protein
MPQKSFELRHLLVFLKICSFVHQCNTFTSYILLIVDMFRPHTAIFRCLYLFIYLFTNCNWAYARWQCLHKMNEHK